VIFNRRVSHSCRDHLILLPELLGRLLLLNAIFLTRRELVTTLILWLLLPSFESVSLSIHMYVKGSPEDLDLKTWG
jgi:hypothetical protein